MQNKLLPDQSGAMTGDPPVYTRDTECRDCYKCVRNCPVKAIRLEQDRATVLPELCIACGYCVEACPVKAKRIRSDLSRVRRLLAGEKPVYVSLAPSFVSEFPDLAPARLIHILKQMGFRGVSETALGAQQISARIARRLTEPAEIPECLISSACPTVVELLTKYYPEQASNLTDLLSPVLAHCRLLRQEFGNDIAIVFISPCVAKKKEADKHPELLDAAITFVELREWLKIENLHPRAVEPGDEDRFVPYPAREGALYPIDGGMIESIRRYTPLEQANCMTFSGIGAIQEGLENLQKIRLTSHLFLELLTCQGGCVNGPAAQGEQIGTIWRRQAIFNYTRPTAVPSAEIAMNLQEPLEPAPVPARLFHETEIREALRKVGKYKPEDELNCGGCGYDKCREFARALLASKAETTMCLSYMRKLAQTKASALLKTMPSAVVIVDDQLKVVESNQPFARLLGPEALEIFEVKPGMEGASLPRLADFHGWFSRVLETGREILDQDLRYRQHVLRISIFSIEPHRLVGGIIQDITQPAMQRGEVIRRAREVINKNLETVQEIACLLGENAAESEVILDSIIDSFTP